jgi:hypothetical protein
MVDRPAERERSSLRGLQGGARPRTDGGQRLRRGDREPRAVPTDHHAGLTSAQLAHRHRGRPGRPAPGKGVKSSIDVVRTHPGGRTVGSRNERVYATTQGGRDDQTHVLLGGDPWRRHRGRVLSRSLRSRLRPATRSGSRSRWRAPAGSCRWPVPPSSSRRLEHDGPPRPDRRALQATKRRKMDSP